MRALGRNTITFCLLSLLAAAESAVFVTETVQERALKLTNVTADTVLEGVPYSSRRRRWKRRISRLLGSDTGKKKAKSACNPNYCRNGGKCEADTRLRSAGGFHCICKPQFSGLRCDNGPFLEDADCLKIPCRGRGRCIHTTKGFQCQCEAGFTGDTCEGSDGTVNKDYSVTVIVIVSLVLLTCVLLGIFVTIVENERQNRMDKYYFYIRLRMKTPESTSFLPVACSVCKQYCRKLCRLSTKNKSRKSSKHQRAFTSHPQTPGHPRTPGALGQRFVAPSRPAQFSMLPRGPPPQRFPPQRFPNMEFLTRFPRQPRTPPAKQTR